MMLHESSLINSSDKTSIIEHPNQDACESYIQEAFKNAKKVKILTIRGQQYFLSSRSLLYDMCLTKKDKGFSILVLVLSPESSHITENLAGELGHNSVERIRKKMRIVMFVSSFAGGGPKNDRNVIMLEIRRDGNPLFIGLERYFDEAYYVNLVHPTGKIYIQYNLSIAKYLAEAQSEPSVIAAAIVCPPLSIGEKVLTALKRTFKEEDELLELVEEILQISHFEDGIWPSTQTQNECREQNEILRKVFLLAVDEAKSHAQEQYPFAAVHFQKKERQQENLIRMFLATTTDIRALVIKLVDRLYFMKYIKDLPSSHQQSMNYKLLAKITLTIYAPLADRLGMWKLKSGLEDMSFRLLEPDKYKAIARQLDLKKQEREGFIDQIIPILKDELKEFEIEAQIVGRAKHIYGIYKKMEAKQLAFDKINDLLGVRIIVDKEEDCYNVQSILHEYWRPITETYDGKAGRDWIANPKENLYQSLHTTILIADKAVEVQIRTRKMHEIAEYGVTALKDAVHWRYKESKAYNKAKTSRVAGEKQRSKQLAELRTILTGEEETSVSKDEQEAIISMLKGLLEDRIFVITPEGHVIDLPAHATPLDFAYRIHTERGHRYTGAKVDDHTVRLDYELKNGDIVELLPSRGKGPSPAWLSMSKDDDGKRYYLFARTRQARNKIRSWLNKYNEEYKAMHNESLKSKQIEVQKPKTSR
jgi:RelA/SpoT family (p)ppGpp synthetase